MNIEEKAKELAQQEKEIEQENKNALSTTNSMDVVSDISLQDLNNKYLNQQVDNGATLQDISLDYAKAKTTTRILDENSEEAEKYRKELAEQQKDTIKESFRQDKVKQQAQTLSEKQKKAEAFYDSVRPILEFDFSNLINKKDDKEKNAKKYSDRSYGIPLMVGMLLFLTFPYFIVSIVLAIFNGINAIIEEINTFGKVARSIVLTILILIFALLIIYSGLCGVEKIFNIGIIHR